MSTAEDKNEFPGLNKPKVCVSRKRSHCAGPSYSLSKPQDFMFWSYRHKQDLTSYHYIRSTWVLGMSSLWGNSLCRSMAQFFIRNRYCINFWPPDQSNWPYMQGNWGSRRAVCFTLTCVHAHGAAAGSSARISPINASYKPAPEKQTVSTCLRSLLQQHWSPPLFSVVWMWDRDSKVWVI